MKTNFKRITIIYGLLLCFKQINLFNCQTVDVITEKLIENHVNSVRNSSDSDISDNYNNNNNNNLYTKYINNDEIIQQEYLSTTITPKEHTTVTTGNNFNLFMDEEEQLQNNKQQRDKYLEHIFNKYGNHDLITFEGLEHLMHNLGLGGLEFKHTLEEHHPDGYQLPELEIYDEIDENITKYNDNNDIVMKINKNLTNNNDVLRTDATIIINNVMVETIDDEISFKAMHDPKHRHPRHHDHGFITKSCLTPTSIVKLLLNEEKLMSRSLENYKINQRESRSIGEHHDDNHHDDVEIETDNESVSRMKLTRNNFINLCPILLVQLEQNACNKDDISQRLNNLGNNYSKTKAWLFASIAILIISMCGLAGVTIVPLAKTLAYQEILRFLVALAVGTLCGDALMHLMPHALSSHKYGNKEEMDDEAIWLCAFTFLSALFMYVIEVMLPLLRGDDKSEHGHGHSHHHHHHHHHHNNPDYDKQQQPQQEHQNDDNLDKIQTNKDLTLMLDESVIDKKDTKLHPVAFMVVIGDGLHNITDGLAIGAAFALDPVTGMATAFAVLCHELPHELGDFALLLKTGVTIKRAMFLNIISSILSFIGMACGLLIAGIHTSFVKWIYSATAGSFLYIALADLLPEMGRGGHKSFKSSIIQIIGISIGGLIMLVIAINEDSLRILFE